jgi:hypothetical protein
MDNTITRVPPGETAWDPERVAAFLLISKRHLRDIRREDPTFPPPCMLGSKPRWSPEVVPAWLAARGGSATVPAAEAAKTARKAKAVARV